ncbi:MAG: hypothetical protein J0H86_16455 [Xanthomonadaceae bacterium]|nr:hypothetical protein [Xanthomonadaceae bacterium]
MKLSELYVLQVEWAGWLRDQATTAPSSFIRDDFRERADAFEHDAANVAQLAILLENPSLDDINVDKFLEGLKECPFKNLGRGALFRGIESVRRWLSGDETELSYWLGVRSSKPTYVFRNFLKPSSSSL